jgi:hypothetical protein
MLCNGAEGEMRVGTGAGAAAKVADVAETAAGNNAEATDRAAEEGVGERWGRAGVAPEKTLSYEGGMDTDARRSEGDVDPGMGPRSPCVVARTVRIPVCTGNEVAVEGATSATPGWDGPKASPSFAGGALLLKSDRCTPGAREVGSWWLGPGLGPRVGPGPGVRAGVVDSQEEVLPCAVRTARRSTLSPMEPSEVWREPPCECAGAKCETAGETAGENGAESWLSLRGMGEDTADVNVAGVPSSSSAMDSWGVRVCGETDEPPAQTLPQRPQRRGSLCSSACCMSQTQ